jgi:hypothetical protein
VGGTIREISKHGVHNLINSHLLAYGSNNPSLFNITFVTSILTGGLSYGNALTSASLPRFEDVRRLLDVAQTWPLPHGAWANSHRMKECMKAERMCLIQVDTMSRKYGAVSSETPFNH